MSLTTDTGRPTLFVFIIDPWFFQQAEIGAMRIKFLMESLAALDASLRNLGSRLTILCGESQAVMERLLTACFNHGMQPFLYFNRDIQVKYGLQRDAAIRAFCKQHTINLHEGLAYFLLTDEAEQDDWHHYYYQYQAAHRWKLPSKITPYDPEWLTAFEQLQPDRLIGWAAQFVPNIHTSSLFTGGETAGQQTLISFMTERYHGYHWKLSRPYLAQRGATSQLSPHIAFGTVSTRQVTSVAYTLMQRLRQDQPDEVRTVESFINRVRWRDSFTQRLLFFPELIWKNRFPEFDMLYQDEPLIGKEAEYFEAWKAGTTGFPLLDASMRQLAHDGWINFRMRAQAVTMLCIIFGVSWHHGARYFMQQLVDGDIAINHWQWQMQAGITNPLSPTFRIYSPDKNLRERDPRLQYIHHWLPEYRAYQTPDEVLDAAQPIIDFTKAKDLHGRQISALRRQVRERIEREGGQELHEAGQLHTRTSHLNRQYRQTRQAAAQKSKPAKTKAAKAVLTDQISLFEAGDG